MIFDPAVLFGGMLFAGVGFILFRYGRAEGNHLLLLVGAALMVYPYFTSTVLFTWGIGAALCALAWYLRE